MFNKVPVIKQGSVVKFPNNITFAKNDKPLEVYSKSLRSVLLGKSKDCPFVKGEFERSYWAPIRDYRYDFVQNRVPPIEDIFGYCSRDGKVQINELHQFKTDNGYPQLSPFLHKHLIKKMQELSEKK
eukprot:NODE_158_length_16653_cov_0.456929.p13 type:complete len:127 gc:universal NODE_158_length_16653_cov_0.456929:9621-9241(-)